MTTEKKRSSHPALFGAETTFDVWVAPRACSELLPDLRKHFDKAVSIVEIVELEDDELLEGPAVLLLTSDDLDGAHREALLGYAERALPGRPVIFGGSSDRDTLLDAINTWRAYRLLPRRASMDLLHDAIHKAYEAYALEMEVNLGVQVLQEECGSLDEALEELNQTQRQLLHVERLATVGRFSRMLQQKLGTFYTGIEEFKRSLDEVEVRGSVLQLLDAAVDASLGIKTLLDDMAALTEDREEELEQRDEDLDRIILRACEMFERHPDIKYRSFRVSCSSGAVVHVDRHRLFHALMNLVRNAIQATERDDIIELRTECHRDNALIEVRDHGCGMTEEIKSKIFQPFFSTKGQNGMGLGLRMTRSAITRQGGELECESTPDEGTCFRIAFPLVSGCGEETGAES